LALLPAEEALRLDRSRLLALVLGPESRSLRTRDDTCGTLRDRFWHVGSVSALCREIKVDRAELLAVLDSFLDTLLDSLLHPDTFD